MMLWLDIDNKKVIRGKYLIPNMPMQVWDDGNEEFLEAVGIYKAIIIDPTFDLGLNNAIEVIDWATKTISYTAQPKSIEVIVPQSITKVQAMLQLKALGLWDTFKTFLASNDDANDIWTLAMSVDRDNSFVSIMAQVVGWDEVQTDNFFIEAVKL